MKIRNAFYFVSCKLFPAALTFLTIIVFTLSANADHSNLRGPAFSDPNSVQDMPEGWNKKPVKYMDDKKDADIVIDVNQQLFPFLMPVIEKYGRDKGLKIMFTEGTCGKSAGFIERKEVDIGSFCCPPGELDRLPGVKYHTLGVMPLNIFVHPDNPVENVSLNDLRGIFKGDIRKWSEVGGANSRIQVIASMHCKLRPGHWRLLLKDENEFSLRMIEEGDMSDTIALVASDPFAIGYEAWVVAERFKERGLVKSLKIDGYDPADTDNTLKGLYPVYRTYSITTWEGQGVENHQAQKLARHLIREVEKLSGKLQLVPASALRKGNWKFRDDELIGEPHSR